MDLSLMNDACASRPNRQITVRCALRDKYLESYTDVLVLPSRVDLEIG
jgi:hypothetical protein